MKSAPKKMVKGVPEVENTKERLASESSSDERWGRSVGGVDDN